MSSFYAFPGTVQVGTVTTLAPNTSATVANAGSPENVVLNFGIPAGAAGATGSTGSRLLDEILAIQANGAFSVGQPGQVPFGVGPVLPPGTAFYSISADAYNPIHLASGSFC